MRYILTIIPPESRGFNREKRRLNDGPGLKNSQDEQDVQDMNNPAFKETGRDGQLVGDGIEKKTGYVSFEERARQGEGQF